MQWAKLWFGSCNTKWHILALNCRSMTAHFLLSQLLTKKSQGSAWCTIKTKVILLSENWRLYFPQRNIRFRTEAERSDNSSQGGENGQIKAQVLYSDLNIQITDEHKDMYSFTAWALKKHEIIFMLFFLNKTNAFVSFQRQKQAKKDTKQYLLNNLLVYKSPIAKQQRKKKGKR